MTKLVPEHTRRLAQLVNRPGGLTVDEAVSSAEQSIVGLRDRGLATIADTFRAMQAIAGEQTSFDEQRCRRLYQMSNSLVGVAGVFGKGGLGEVALSLCTLLEFALLTRHWDGDAIRLHLDSLRLLSCNDVSEVEVTTINAALRQVVERLRKPSNLSRGSQSKPMGEEFS